MDLPQFFTTVAAVGGGVVVTAALMDASRKGFEREQSKTAQRLRLVASGIAASSGLVWGGLENDIDVALPPGDTGRGDADDQPDTAAQRQDDQFASVLIEYYSYGLTQARRSFYASQVISAVGVLVILFGVTLAIWRAETSGDMFASIVTSCSGVVSTVIGQLVHRRADIALKHMADQTESLRSDMRAQRADEHAIELLAQVTDPEVKTRLQAGLIMKLSGAAMPEIGSPPKGVTPELPEQSAQA
ncbi:TRADD-N-associated membrane domain-containing protein [Streptomyces pseudovenezuelae]|uniref:TRADD-N-associated membrane domain-containing protein n=1 Tax=Streptomyces pseudovenezuelae TaxID=67350 RepID=UPI0036EF1C89